MVKMRAQVPMRRRESVKDSMFIVEDGCINYLFPFSFQGHPVARDIHDHPRQLADPPTYRRQVVHSIHLLCNKIPSARYGMTWLPSEGWDFAPWRFAPGEEITPLDIEALTAGASPNSAGYEDLAALAASDGFFYLSEYLRRQPLVRIRLSDSVAVVPETDSTPLVPKVNVDLTLHLALGQGCLVFRHAIRNLSVDDLIGIRLTQFRRGMPCRWIEIGPKRSEPQELQDLYLSYGRRLFGSAFVPTYDVRQYAAVLEVRKVRQRDGHSIEFEQIKESAPKWLYGLLHVDERWRDIDTGKAAEALSQAVSHTERYRQYCQSVSLLVLHSTDTRSPHAGPTTHNTLDHYYWNLRSNLQRTVADRSCVMEALMAQENLLVCLYEDYRSLVGPKAPSRSAVQRLRKDLVVSRQEADESFNIVPGEELLTGVRGLARWRQRIQEASSILETILDDYRKYNSELLGDLGSSTGVGLSVLSILFSLGTRITLCTRWGITVGLGFLALTRWYKHKDRVAAVLLAVWILVSLFLWLAPVLW